VKRPWLRYPARDKETRTKKHVLPSAELRFNLVWRQRMMSSFYIC